MKTRILTAQSDGPGHRSITFGDRLPIEAQAELLLWHRVLIVHLLPEGSIGVVHSHDAIGKLRSE